VLALVVFILIQFIISQLSALTMTIKFLSGGNLFVSAQTHLGEAVSLSKVRLKLKISNLQPPKVI